MVLNDEQIRALCVDVDDPMLSPFIGEKTREPGSSLSYGLSHFGYDIRIADKLLIPQAPPLPIDPRRSESVKTQRIQVAELGRTPELPGEECIVLEPGDFVMAGTLEYFRMPDDVVAVVHDKSTLARLGIAVQNTVLEPGWEGYLTVEISNHGVNHVMISHKMPIAQVIFMRGDRPSSTYAGRYQAQPRGTGALG